MLIEGLPVLDTGPFGESRRPGAHSQTREGFEQSAGTTATENHFTTEWHTNR